VTAGWVEQHKALKPGNAELQAALDEWMEEFEAEEERRRAEALAVQQDDGWTLVQRHKVRTGGLLLELLVELGWILRYSCLEWWVTLCWLVKRLVGRVWRGHRN
jgi:hypothetical protein